MYYTSTSLILTTRVFCQNRHLLQRVFYLYYRFTQRLFGIMKPLLLMTVLYSTIHSNGCYSVYGSMISGSFTFLIESLFHLHFLGRWTADVSKCIKIFLYPCREIIFSGLYGTLAYYFNPTSGQIIR